jgi:hypothetical protein
MVTGTFQKARGDALSHFTVCRPGSFREGAWSVSTRCRVFTLGFRCLSHGLARFSRIEGLLPIMEYRYWGSIKIKLG